MGLPTPLYDLKDFPDVYEPSEDSHLFLDALEADQESILARSPKLACEIGSGSGILITGLAQLLKNSCAYFSTDINFSACRATAKTALINNSYVESVAMDLLGMFRSPFDVILFNPPYVVTESDEIMGRGLDRAYAGGCGGREIIDKFLATLPSMLSENGVCYLLLLKENNVEDIKEKIRGLGLKGRMVLERKIPGEHLFVFKYFR
ncbi:methyltransferase N6AMT1 isoform X1 [Dendroctonus ponderosae]|uniref:Methyltransferase HEMK2 n=2 Tax=Dendroctonus ponderosae TaxID=77166 RepID=U4UH57_DENPD|nr:methyltransferase N6AMT1 isoform X1 [Dendroctonus ponderosae]XP_048518223.1 methyltransferase N6AMT1 isoform X1 [Dendroctonus ponderosae]ERL89921.1 hypothetical protein D910_07280 [Dendroctonus ponderosae]KAH1001008.1 hypothetical protein HUJ04_013272 [Dendroctonus ponderosae]KAH1006423.1 hypothetical protein HUJ05_007159 [Dendroctonus ponderosae]